MNNAKRRFIDKSLNKKQFVRMNEEQKEYDEKLTFDENQLFILFREFFAAIEHNQFNILSKTINSIINMINPSNPLFVSKIQEYARTQQLNFIDSAMGLIINPPDYEQFEVYLNLIITLLSIRNNEITEYIIQDPDYIEFFDKNLFQMHESDQIIYILNIIGLISDDLTTLKIRFCDLFPSFSFEYIQFVLETIDEIGIEYIFIIIVSKICSNLRYGEFYSNLIFFLVSNYRPYYDPGYFFNVLNLYVERYPLDAYEKLVDSGFLYGEEGIMSVFDFLVPETFCEESKYYYNYCYFTLKFLNILIKKKNEIKDQILKNIPVDSLCNLIFDDFVSVFQDQYPKPTEVVCIALKMLIKDCKREDGDVNYIYNIFYDKFSRNDNDNVLIDMFEKGNFKLKYRLLCMLEMTVENMLHISVQKSAKNNDNDVVLDLLSPNLIQIVADLLLSEKEKLSNLVVHFLDFLITKAIEFNLGNLVELVSTDYVTNSLSQFIDSQEFDSDSSLIAQHVLYLIQSRNTEEEED